MGAWHSGKLSELLQRDPQEIVNHLAATSVSKNLPPSRESLDAWATTIETTIRLASDLSPSNPQVLGWHYFLEFEIPLRARRIDLVIIASDIVLLIECKTHAEITQSDLWQIQQYALDMRDFHSGCRNRMILPLLLAIEATTPNPIITIDKAHHVQAVQRINPETFALTVASTWRELHDSQQQR